MCVLSHQLKLPLGLKRQGRPPKPGGITFAARMDGTFPSLATFGNAPFVTVCHHSAKSVRGEVRSQKDPKCSKDLIVSFSWRDLSG